MPSLLIRDVPDDVKRALVLRAAENGRSQQAEARAVLEEALCPRAGSWVSLLRDVADSADGIDLACPRRHAPRITGIVS